jgi:hypothetical protein
VHDLTFSQQGVFFPACLPARASCNMWDQSIVKLIEEVEKWPALYLKSLKEYSDTNHKKLWEEVCTALIENWNGLAPEEKKKLKAIIYTLGQGCPTRRPRYTFLAPDFTLPALTLIRI